MHCDCSNRTNEIKFPSSCKSRVIYISERLFILLDRILVLPVKTFRLNNYNYQS